MPAGRKRGRASAPTDVPRSTPPTAAALRAALAARCDDDSPRGAWRAAAAAAGVAGADAFLCHLGRSIAAALQTVPIHAEAARARLRSTRAALLSAVNLRCDELDERIADAESSKITALERELFAVDAALESLRAERGTAAEAAASLKDAELVARHAELAARVDAAEAQLLALPTSVIEPPHVGLLIDEPSLLAIIAATGQVVAPRAVTAADLACIRVPTHARPGSSLIFQLQHMQPTEEQDLSLFEAAAAATYIEPALKAEGAAPQLLHAKTEASHSRRSVIISIVIPATAPVGSLVCFGSLAVFGQPVSGLLRALRVEPPCPTYLSPEHAAWLQSQLPPGGSSCRDEWEEVYRATTHGFCEEVFLKRCGRRTRLLILVRTREGGWLLGGFTAVGFRYGNQRIDPAPATFLFSLTNSLGRPEKLNPSGTIWDLFYYGASGWLVSEVVAWAV